MTAWITHFIRVSLLSSCLSPLMHAQKQTEVEQLWQFICQGLTTSRQEIRTGAFRAEGRLVDDSPSEAFRIEREVEIFCAFDHTNDALRFDRAEVLHNASSYEGVKPRIGGKYARSRDGSVHYMEGGTEAVVFSRDHPSATDARPFDVRSLGLCYWHDLETGRSFSDLLNQYNQQAPLDINERDGIYRIRWRLAADHRRSVWVDEKRGFAPIRLEVVDRRHADGSPEWDAPSIVSDVTWEQIAGVWIPTTFHIEERLLSGRLAIYDLALDWESVNEPVSQDLFDIKGFDLPQGTYLIDSRLGQPIVLGAAGRSSVPEFGMVRGRVERDAKTNPIATTVVVVAGVIVLVVSGMLLFRRFHTRRLWH